MKSKNLLERLINYLKKKEKNVEVGPPEGLCPNCWGRYEYGGKFYEAAINENVNVNNVSEKKGWILDYAEKHLQKIQLVKEEKQEVCQKCKLTYRPT